jgi:GntR family transcriptional regulator/MocR family aminotransferase
MTLTWTFGESFSIVKSAIDQRESTSTLQRQICNHFRRLISEQILKPGQKLPSSRSLAYELGVARNTVINSYAQLCSEGLLESHVGAGTRVSQSHPHDLSFQPDHGEALSLPLSRYGASLVSFDCSRPAQVESTWNFLLGIDPSMQSPVWSRLVARHRRSGLSTADNESFHLRDIIATYLNNARRTKASADQLFLFQNSEQALDFICRMHLDSDDPIVLEDPCGAVPKAIFGATGATLVPISVDQEGIVVDGLNGVRAKLAYVTPSHQFPSGAVMSEVRRAQLLAWARQNGSLIVEDDRGFEYRYAGNPPSCMQGVGNSRVIYLGDFANPIPSMSLTYLVVPKQLVAHYRASLQLVGISLSDFERRALSEFIANGSLQRHVQAQTNLLNKRRIALIYHLRRLFGSTISIRGDIAAAHISVEFVRCSRDLGDLIHVLRQKGVHVELMRTVDTKSFTSTLVLGYGRISEQNIKEAVEIIGDTFKSYLSHDTASSVAPRHFSSLSGLSA